MQTETANFVRVRGTMVSTRMTHPSKLPIQCVQQWGMPNQYGNVICDDLLLYIRYDNEEENVIHVWASRIDTAAALESALESVCSVS